MEWGRTFHIRGQGFGGWGLGLAPGGAGARVRGTVRGKAWYPGGGGRGWGTGLALPPPPLSTLRADASVGPASPGGPLRPRPPVARGLGPPAGRLAPAVAHPPAPAALPARRHRPHRRGTRHCPLAAAGAGGRVWAIGFRGFPFSPWGGRCTGRKGSKRNLYSSQKLDWLPGINEGN